MYKVIAYKVILGYCGTDQYDFYITEGTDDEISNYLYEMAKEWDQSFGFYDEACEEDGEDYAEEDRAGRLDWEYKVVKEFETKEEAEEFKDSLDCPSTYI